MTTEGVSTCSMDLNKEPDISLRRNASTKARGSPLRREEVLLIRKLGYDKWKELKDARSRCIGRYYPPQSIRILGEGLFSKKFRTQKAEAGLKVMLYNKLMDR